MSQLVSHLQHINEQTSVAFYFFLWQNIPNKSAITRRQSELCELTPRDLAYSPVLSPVSYAARCGVDGSASVEVSTHFWRRLACLWCFFSYYFNLFIMRFHSETRVYVLLISTPRCNYIFLLIGCPFCIHIRKHERLLSGNEVLTFAWLWEGPGKKQKICIVSLHKDKI